MFTHARPARPGGDTDFVEAQQFDLRRLDRTSVAIGRADARRQSVEFCLVNHARFPFWMREAIRPWLLALSGQKPPVRRCGLSSHQCGRRPRLSSALSMRAIVPVRANMAAL